MAAKQVANSGRWRRSGERSAAHFVARKAGTTVGQAVATLETRRLAELPASGP
jgi:hypothetical protein